MGYMHIDNLYCNQDILLFKECYALEKIHGTSAHISWNEGEVRLFSGGAKHALFTDLFNLDALADSFRALGHPRMMVYGEAYGGKINAQAWRYGNELRFVAFDVRIGDLWLSVPRAEDVVKKMWLEFVYYDRIGTDLPSIDAQRDAPSVQAQRNEMGIQPREGVVLRPLIEVTKNNGARIMAKHKRDEERETRSPRVVDDPAKLAVLTAAEDIAREWVTPTRLEHVLDKIQGAKIEDMPKVLAAMVEDVTREAEGEIVDSREARRAISAATAKLFRRYLKGAIQ